MIYSSVIFFSALFSLGYSDCGQLFSIDTAKPECLIPRNCKAWRQLGVTQCGIYPVKPDSGEKFEVYCDMDTDGGGWTVFQRRKDGSVNFYRNWADYKQGFGDFSGEFWLGLDKIHRLTTADTHSLRVDLRDFDDTYKYAQYSSFSVGDEGSKYTLSVSGYSGTAGDSLAFRHNGMKFTTKDQDSDNWSSGHCAIRWTGAWWYNKCLVSNLNGQYLKNSQNLQGINWYYTWKRDSLKFTEMKFRQN